MNIFLNFSSAFPPAASIILLHLGKQHYCYPLYISYLFPRQLEFDGYYPQICTTEKILPD